MMNFTYWPYDEVLLESISDQHLAIKTPWIEATTSKEFFDTAALEYLSKNLNEKTLSGDDVGLVHDFFKHFRAYPFAYILPSLKQSLPTDKHEMLDSCILTSNFNEALKIIFEGVVDVEQLACKLSRTGWEWDYDAALDFASINNTIHPESLLSVSKRFHLIETMQSDKGHELFNDIENLSGVDFKKALAHLIRQNHYVTEQCQEALKPAIAIAGQASSLIQEFMDEERGHDKILRKALLYLDDNPENIEVNIQTKALMHVLAYVARRNFLAFTMTIAAFERSNFQDTDPMAQLLQKGGYTKAADFINLHMKINDNGNHENIAITFLQFMDLCDRDYAREALRLMEIVSLVMCSVTSNCRYDYPLLAG